MSTDSERDYEERASSVSDIRLDVTDDELKKLSEYFEKSSVELQKKVDSILNVNFLPKKSSKQNLSEASSSSNLKSVSSLSFENENKSLKGIPIDIETATLLRQLTVSSCVHSFSSDWKRAKFLFRENDSEICYGLISEKNGSKGLILSVQTILLKNFILKSYKDIHGKEVVDSKWRNERKILKPNETERKEVLCESLAEILWKAGKKSKAFVTINSQFNCFDFQSNNQDRKTNYIGDGITERLHIYEIDDLKVLQGFIRKNLNMFQKDGGCILFLYSLILSRQINNLLEDLQESVLIGDMEDCKISLFNLVINGVAVPYLHNGLLHYDALGKALEKPLVGLKSRSEVGILYWNSKEDDLKRTEVGSMLKTPKYPIWLSIMGKNLIAVLFNTNVDLLNDWRLEQSFSLHFYSGLKKQEVEYKITVDTRNLSSNWDERKTLKLKYPHLKLNDDDKEPEVFKLILTKWPDSDIVGTDGKELMSLL